MTTCQCKCGCATPLNADDVDNLCADCWLRAVRGDEAHDVAAPVTSKEEAK